MVPICPSSVEPISDIFHVVMLSASLNFSCARPCLSVSSDGCHTSVSGKYSRRRGVESCEPPDLVTTLTFLSPESCLPFKGKSVTADWLTVVCRLGSEPVPVTVSVVAPSRSATLTSTILDERTNTFVITVDVNPRASNLNSYKPGNRFAKIYFPSSSLDVE